MGTGNSMLLFRWCSRTRAMKDGRASFLVGGRRVYSSVAHLLYPVIVIMCVCGLGGPPYAYTADLLTLASRRAVCPLPSVRGWSHIKCPMVPELWEECLASHPDRAYVDYLVRGLQEGFRIGFRHGSASCHSASTNMQSADVHPVVISNFLRSEVAAGRVLGPVEPDVAAQVQVNRFGLVPKGHQPGKWRLIVDLSFPRGHSVNDGIEPEMCTLHYTSVDEACKRVFARDRGTVLAKFDVEGAFRTVPVHPDDRRLLGMRWEGQIFVDKVLPFGLRSAPKLYNAVADALLWILENSDGVDGLHYLDDFLLFGDPDSQQCEQALQSALARCDTLGVPVAQRKTEGPSTTLTFLGLELDTTSLTVRLPPAKLDRLRREIQRWEGLKSCSKRELLSIIGQLQHACCAIRPGRSFLRRMIELSKCVRELHHRVRLNAGFRSDLRWWGCFLPIWNGSCPMATLCRVSPQVALTSDASGSWGCGAFTSDGKWFQLQLHDGWDGIHITVKELLPIVLGVAIWGSEWKGLTIVCFCDNAAVVAIVNSGRSKMDRAMHLMRCLSFFLARWGVSLVCRHIPGTQNGAADALSCGVLPSFQRLVPRADREPTTLPDNLLQCLVHGTPDWTRVDWIALFGHSS